MKALILLAFALPAQAEHIVPIDTADAWLFTCSVVGVERCADVAIPTIVVLSPEEGPCYGTVWGAFSPVYSDKIFLCGALLYYADPVFIQSVVAHEFTHYLDNIAHPDIEGCETEWNAHRVGNAYVYSHGHKEWADFDWQDWYGCFGR